MRLARQSAPSRHGHRELAARAGGEKDRRRLRIGLHLEADLGEHLGDCGADLAVAGKAVLGEREGDLEPVLVARLLHQLLGLGDVELARRLGLVEAEDRRRHHLVDLLAEAFHGDRGQRLAVDGEVHRHAHALVEERILGEGLAVLAHDLASGRLLPHIHLEVEDVDGVDGLNADLGVALQRLHVGGGNTIDEVELSGLQLGDASGVVWDLLAHDPLPGLLWSPEPVETLDDEVALRRPGDVLVRPRADGGLAGIERLVGVLLGETRRRLARDDEQTHEIIGERRRRAIGDDVDGQRVDDLGLLHAPDVDRGRIRARYHRNALD